MGMMGKLQQTQQKMDEAKKRLDTVLIDEKSTDGLLQVTVTANRAVRSVTIADELMQDKEQLEDYLVTVMNRAMQRASEVHETEMGAVAKDGMPDIPGLNFK